MKRVTMNSKLDDLLRTYQQTEQEMQQYLFNKFQNRFAQMKKKMRQTEVRSNLQEFLFIKTDLDDLEAIQKLKPKFKMLKRLMKLTINTEKMARILALNPNV